jgi:hypothetical protein
MTHINDPTQGSEADLTGIDLRWQINEQTLCKAEIADSNSTVSNVAQSGSTSAKTNCTPLTAIAAGNDVEFRAFSDECHKAAERLTV